MKKIESRVKKTKVAQTSESFLVAVREDGMALRYMKEQTPEICLEAVRQDSRALRYVKEQTTEICLETVRQDGRALQFVKQQTPAICLEAVKSDGRALRYAKRQTEKLCLAAIRQCANVMKWGWEVRQDDEEWLDKEERYGTRPDEYPLNSNLLRLVKRQTLEICRAAVRKDGMELQYVKNGLLPYAS
jgi:hypothetical protein